MNVISSFKQHKLLTLSSIVGVLLLFIIIFTYVKQVSPVSWGWYGEVLQSNEFAINGYDSVNYYHNNTAVSGDKSYRYLWKGANWIFSSEQNKALFVASPNKYAPQFGGFCAFAMSKGFTAESDSSVWHIKDNKLYLFADASIKRNWLTQLENGIDQLGSEKWQTH